MKELLIDTPHYQTWLEDGIMHLVYKPDLIITLEIAKQMVDHRLQTFNGKTYPVFIDIRNLIAIKADARKHLAGPEAIKYISAGAIYLDSYIQYLVGTIFLKIDKPAIPARLFTEKEKAFEWLELFKTSSHTTPE